MKYLFEGKDSGSDIIKGEVVQAKKWRKIPGPHEEPAEISI